MSYAHVCNIFFEKELESPSHRSLVDWLRIHPVVFQLQFLPLLYAAPNDSIFVSDLPENPDPRLKLLEPTDLLLIDWGPSQAISRWNKSYSIPPWENVRTLNSKIFSFTHSPKLPHAELLANEAEANLWLAKTPGPKVLKTPFGTAGNGHIHNEKYKSFPLIGEPWVERILDFSTQWKDGQLLGATVFENDAKGTYKSTLAGDPQKLLSSHFWALEEHLNAARPLIQHFPKGHVGIDAFIYRWNGKEHLHPIVEINGRKTMSWVALHIQQTHYPSKMLRFFYTHNSEGFLPSRLQNHKFKRNISYDVS